MNGESAILSLKRAQHMIGTTEPDFATDLLRQIGPILGEERDYGIETLLQMTLRIDEIQQIVCVFAGVFVAAHHFAGDFAFEFAELITDFRGAFARGGFERGVKLQKTAL